MADCCAPKGISKEERRCPSCRGEGAEVGRRTMKHWLKPERLFDIPEERFSFCTSGDCPVVYFSVEGSIYGLEDVRAPLGRDQKNPFVCYCFAVTEEMIAGAVRSERTPPFSELIRGEVRDGSCACDVRNPSGRCCLGEVGRLEALYSSKRG